MIGLQARERGLRWRQFRGMQRIGKGVGDVVPIYAVNGMVSWNETAQATECGTNAFGPETPGGIFWKHFCKIMCVNCCICDQCYFMVMRNCSSVWGKQKSFSSLSRVHLKFPESNSKGSRCHKIKPVYMIVPTCNRWETMRYFKWLIPH